MNRLKWLLAAALASLGLLVAVSTGGAEREIRRLQAREQHLRTQVAGIRDRQERLSEALQSVGQWDGVLLTGDRYAAILQLVTLAEEKSGVRIRALQPQVAEAGGGYQRITVTVAVAGSLLQIYRFVDAIEMAPLLARVSGIQYWDRDGGRDRGGNITLTFYGGP